MLHHIIKLMSRSQVELMYCIKNNFSEIISGINKLNYKI